MWTRPSPSTVVTIDSRIIGIGQSFTAARKV
jgi:hypothetical protein